MTTKNFMSNCIDMRAVLPLPLLSEHANKGSQPIGEIYHLRKSPRGVYMRAALFDHIAARYAEGLIRKGETRCLSVGHDGQALLAEVDGLKFYSNWKLKEISICRSGANADCYFEIHHEGDIGKKFWEPSSAPKAEPRIAYRGPWKQDEQYQPGDFASFQGGLWHAEIESKGVRPNDAPMVWKLSVKRGAVEKMEKRHAQA